MKILLSAYACEPNKGSEPGVGWNWAVALAKYHQVCVVTRDNNQPTIENYLKSNPQLLNENLKFIYVGLSKKLTFWKKGNRGIRLYYTLWQRKAAKVASEWNDRMHFDLVQHITFVSYTQTTYMYRLKIPLIWGPISGGENIPSGIGIEMSMKEKMTETIRKTSQQMALIMLSIRKTMRDAKYILVATDETKEKIPQKYQYKTRLISAIGLEKIPDLQPIKKNNDKVQIIMAGRLIYWKAFDIGLRAFLRIADQFPNAELHILGEGNQKKKLEKIAGTYLEKQVFFEDPVPHDQIFEFYRKYDIFLNTTLRDSGCMTMMEAMSTGLPCIAIETGGPKVLLNGNSYGSVASNSYEKCIEEMADRLGGLIENPALREKISIKQINFLRSRVLMNKKIELVNEIYKTCVKTPVIDIRGGYSRVMLHTPYSLAV
jgi:glycosyltransferase involved in cell wall biosynthesis